MVQHASKPAPDLILIAGQIAAGKSSVALALEARCGAKLIRVRDALTAAIGGSGTADRLELQRRGAELDARTNGQWLLHHLLEHHVPGERWVLDAARTRRQTEPILTALPSSCLVYLEAVETTRRHRYTLGQVTDPVKRSTVFDHAMRHSTESDAAALRSMAAVTIETDDLAIDEVATAIAGTVGWY